MEYKHVTEMGMPLIIATHKGVTISLAEGEDWVCIYSCESKDRLKGNCQEAINIIKKDYSYKKLNGSVPLNHIMQHIYNKCGVSYEL